MEAEDRARGGDPPDGGRTESGQMNSVGSEAASTATAGPSVGRDVGGGTRTDRFERVFCIGCFVACLVINLMLASVGWNNTAREVHDSRQVQTAISIKYLQEEGWSLAYPLPVFGPPWSAPFEFPLYQYTAAKLATLTGLGVEQAGRAAALFYFYLTLPALFLLQRFIGIEGHRRWLLLALVLVTPGYAYYSRSVMIESTALCAGLWFLWFFCSALQNPRVGLLTAAAITGALAGAVKLPTLSAVLVPAAAWTLVLLRREKTPQARGRVALAATLLAGTALGAGVAWTGYCDSIKAANPLEAHFVSSGLRRFVFGTLEQRLDAETWKKVLWHAQISTLSPFNVLLPLLIGPLLSRRGIGTWAVLVATFAVTPLIFWNLYAVHDYYFFACGVALLAAMAMAWGNILDSDAFGRKARFAIVGVTLALQLVAHWNSYATFQRKPGLPPPAAASILRQITEPTDLLLVYGQDWNPTLAYYADRRAIMVVNDLFEAEAQQDEVLHRVRDETIGALVVSGPARLYPEFAAKIARKVGVVPAPFLVGPDTYVYLHETRIRDAAARIDTINLQDFAVMEAAANAAGVSRRRYKLADVQDRRIVSMMSPMPRELVHPFGLGVHDVGGRLGTDAHAPTDIVFDVPAGARGITVEFGMLEGSFLNEHKSDGVEFRIELSEPGKERRVLFSRTLTPAATISDRGIQRATADLSEGARGQLLFRTLPGANNSISSDWAYWARIAIE
jgi:hypothetical protein